MKGLFPAFATPQSRSDTWLTSLDEMDRLKPRILVPAHYDVTDASTIEAYRGYLKALQARVGELKRQGKSADETAEIASHFPISKWSYSRNLSEKPRQIPKE